MLMFKHAHSSAAVGMTVGFRRGLDAHTQQLTDSTFASCNKIYALSPESGEDSCAAQEATLMQ